MAENNGNGMLGEISTIRNILMGEQMSQYETKFQALQEDLSKARLQLEKDLKGAANATDDRLSKLEKDMNVRFDKLEQLLSDSLDSMNQKLEATSHADKQQLGKMFAEIGKKLMD